MAVDVQEAVRIAKEHVAFVFEGEGVNSPSLEEVWFDELSMSWFVTVGIRHREMTIHDARTIFGPTTKQVEYKTVQISGAGNPVAIRNYSSAA